MKLTRRERDVASLMARDYSVKRIADKLSVAEETVKRHRKNMYLKFSVHTSGGLIGFLWRAGVKLE